MKKVIVCLIVLGLSVSAWGESLKHRIERLEQEVSETKNMVQKLIDDNFDTTGPGDTVIPVVTGNAPVVINSCDDIIGWEIVSGNTATFYNVTTSIKEGLGAIIVSLGGNSNATVKVTLPAAIDISDHQQISLWMRTSNATDLKNFTLYFGEANYNEQSLGTFNLTGNYVWQKKTWDISGIAANNRNAVTQFGISMQNSGNAGRALSIDYILSVPGPGQIVIDDGFRGMTISPKIFMGNFLSSGNNQTVFISANGTTPATRKGTPASVVTIRGGSTTYNCWVIRHKDMAANNSVRSDGGAMLSDGILSMGDGNFTIGENIRVNPGSNETIYFIALYED